MEIPTEYLVYGGAGIASLIGLVALYKGAKKVVSGIRNIKYHPVMGIPVIAASWGALDYVNGTKIPLITTPLTPDQIKELVVSTSSAPPQTEQALIDALLLLSKGTETPGLEGWTAGIAAFAILISGVWLCHTIKYMD